MLIEILQYIQARDNLNNQQFSDKIGIHRQSWLRIERTHAFGRKFLEGVRQAYPELKEAIDSYLANNTYSGYITSQTPYDGKSGGLGRRVKDYIKRIIKGAGGASSPEPR